MMLAAVMNGRGNGNKDEVVFFKAKKHKFFCVKSFQFLSMQLGMSSTGEKDDAGRPMGSMIASTRGIEDLK